MTDYNVTADTLELRDGPGTQHPVLAQLQRGTSLEGLAAEPLAGWLRVRVLRDGRTGWVSFRWLSAASGNRIGVEARRAALAAAPSPAATPASGPTLSPATPGSGQVADSLVFDISHFNGAVDFVAAYQAGQRAVIHKATEGIHYVDARFHANREAARAAGLRFGAYHFGTGDDPIAQAEHFLATLEPRDGTLLALDLEANPQGPSMSIAQARAFVTHCQARTGKWPGLYSGNTVREALHGAPDPVLAHCWLWLAEYTAHPVVPHPWEGWTLWQFTDGHCGSGPFEVPGVGHCDRSRFAGGAAALAAFWAANA